MNMIRNVTAACVLLLGSTGHAVAKPPAYTLTTQSNGNFSYDFNVDVADYFPGEKTAYFFGSAFGIPAVPGYLTFDLHEKDAGSGLAFTEAYVVIPFGVTTGDRFINATLTNGPVASAKLSLFVDLASVDPSVIYGPHQGFFGVSGPATAGVRGTISFAAVPEPATWAMMLVGFGMLGATIRFRSDRRRTGRVIA